MVRQWTIDLYNVLTSQGPGRIDIRFFEDNVFTEIF